MKPTEPINGYVNVFVAYVEACRVAIRRKGYSSVRRRCQPYMKLLAGVVVFLCLAATRARGTSVVILANSKQIVVAADSKVFQSEEKVCKIFKIGSIYWSFSGVQGNSVTGYEVPNIVKQSYAPHRKVAEMLDIFIRNVHDPLEKTMVHLHNFPDTFEVARRHPLEIAFWRFEEGRPVIAHAFYAAEAQGGKVSINIWEKGVTNCCVANQADGVFVGVKDKIFAYAQSHPDWSQNLINAANLFIGLSVKDQPDTVGPPMDVFVIQPNGSHRWIGSHNCHEEPEESPPPEPYSSK
jgi:hypothetical protein